MKNPPNYVARYWHPESGYNVVCELCPRQCRLKEGQRGFCFVRQNINSQLVLTTYGRTSGFAVDPIEKKPLYHFLPQTNIFSFGTIGCNLGCRFCQNWHISKTTDSALLTNTATPQSIAAAAKGFDCKSVAFTYNEPVIYTEFAVDVAKECRAMGIKTVAVTAGYVKGQAREDFFQQMDAANVDLKAFSEKFYKDLAQASLQPVLETLIYIRKKTKTWLEITTLLIPGENDSEGELEQLCGWVRNELGPETPLHFSAFHPDFQFTHHPTTSPATLIRAREIALAKGLRHVYTGNIHDAQGSTTFCHKCRKPLIERDGFTIKNYHLTGDKCAYCGTACCGFFEEQPLRV